MSIDCSLVVAVDERHAESLRLVWPTWKRYRPELLTWPMLVAVDDALPVEAWHEKLSFLDHPQHQLIPWTMPDAEQREKMLSALVFVPATHVKTPWYLKLDVDVVASSGECCYRPEWFAPDERGRVPAFISSPWSYTKPASWIDDLEAWGDQHAVLREFPRLGLRSEPHTVCFRHRRIASWCFFGNTSWTKTVASYTNARLPVPSQDTYLWYCAARRGDFFRTARMQSMGWRYTAGLGRVARLSQAAMELAPVRESTVPNMPRIAVETASPQRQRPPRHSRVLAGLLARWKGRPFCGAELGVFRGETSQFLLTQYPQLFLYMIDTWQAVDRRSKYGRSHSFAARQTSDEHAANLQAAADATRFAASHRQILRTTTTTAAAHVADESLDFVFVDADHTYDAVRADLLHWWPKVKTEGILSGHDYGYPLDRIGKWGVSRAVNEFAAELGLEVHLPGASIWWIQKPCLLDERSANHDQITARLPTVGGANSLSNEFAPHVPTVSQGILYLLTGAPHGARLIVSLMSLRKHYQGPITLFTTRAPSHRIGELCAADPLLSVHHRKMEEEPAQRNSSYLTKVAVLPSSPYDTTVFLDADTLVVGDLTELFQLADDELIAVPQFSKWVTTGRKMQRRIQRWTNVACDTAQQAEIKRLVTQTYQSRPAINVGVLAYRRSPLLKHWLNLTRLGSRTFIPDEVALQLLLPDYSHRIVDCRFNCSPVYASETQDVRVWHFHGDKHVSPAGRPLWWPSFSECWERNLAQIQTWAPGEDKRLRQALQDHHD